MIDTFSAGPLYYDEELTEWTTGPLTYIIRRLVLKLCSSVVIVPAEKKCDKNNFYLPKAGISAPKNKSYQVYYKKKRKFF